MLQGVLPLVPSIYLLGGMGLKAHPVFQVPAHEVRCEGETGNSGFQVPTAAEKLDQFPSCWAPLSAPTALASPSCSGQSFTSSQPKFPPLCSDLL